MGFYHNHTMYTHTLSEPTDKKLRTLVCEAKMVTMLAISVCELGLIVLKFCVVFFKARQDIRVPREFHPP